MTYDAALAASLSDATTDLISITRAKNVMVNAAFDEEMRVVGENGRLQIAIKAC